MIQTITKKVEQIIKVYQQQSPVGLNLNLNNGEGYNNYDRNDRKNGFENARTTMEQEIHRYEFSFWMFVRVVALIGFPYAMSYAAKHVFLWSPLSNIGNSNDNDNGNHDKQTIDCVLLCGVHAIVIFCFVVHNALYAILYVNKIPYFDQYRVDQKPWHWEIMERHKWNVMLWHTVKVVSFNLVVISYGLIFVTTYLLGMGCQYRYDVESLPTGGEIGCQLCVCLLMEDFVFHHSHQLLHQPRWYWIHAVHHKYHVPIGVSSAYAHPIEYLVGNILPSMCGPQFFLTREKKMHIVTYAVWLVFRICAAIENHSGYEFPWSMYKAIPFKAPTEYHDYHHHRNRENFSGVLRIWDCIYGTNKHYFQWIADGRHTREKKK